MPAWKIKISNSSGGKRQRNLQLFLLFVACIILVLVAVVVLLLLIFFGFLLAFWHLYLLDGCIWVHTKLLGHQPVHTVHERRWVRDLVTRLQQSSLEEHLGGIQSRLVVLVGLDLAQKIGNHGVIGVDFKSLSTRHLADLVLVLERLCLHHSLLLCGIAELRSHNDDGRFRQSLRKLNLLHLHTCILHSTLLG